MGVFLLERVDRKKKVWYCRFVITVSRLELPSFHSYLWGLIMNISKIQDTIRENSGRVAKLGNWPPYISVESLVLRVPSSGSEGPGFDAGLACALDLIPRDKQRLSATLHAAYTAEAVEQVLSEFQVMEPDSETTWWLAACGVCFEGAVNRQQFLAQMDSFRFLASDPEARLRAAQDEHKVMLSTFETETYGFPYGTIDGCIQGSYLAGHQFGTIYAKEYNLYFIGTYLPSLGLEDFYWSSDVDDQDRALSGPVHGSKQFVKCKDLQEFLSAVEVVKRHLLA